MLEQGYIKIHRKLLDSAIWRNLNDWRLAETILLLANWKSGKFMPRDGSPLKVPRGHLVTSLNTLSQKSGLSIQSVRTSLLHLKKAQFLTRTSTHHYQVISVLNYDALQGLDESSNKPINTDLTRTQHRPNNDIRREEGKKERKQQKQTMDSSQSVFKKPGLDAVKAYCKERGGKVDPEKWFDHYQSNGWKVGRNPMKDWRAAVRQWERSNFSNGPAVSSKQTRGFYDPKYDNL